MTEDGVFGEQNGSVGLWSRKDSKVSEERLSVRSWSPYGFCIFPLLLEAAI